MWPRSDYSQVRIREIRRDGVRIGPAAGAYPGDIWARARALVIGVTKRTEGKTEIIQTLARKWTQYMKDTIINIFHHGDLDSFITK